MPAAHSSSVPALCDPGAQQTAWAPAAAATGLAAVGIGAMVCTFNYLALPGAGRLDWGFMPLAIAMFVAFSGLSIGLCVGGGLLLAARRGAGPLGLMFGGAAGGVIAGLAPGIAGIAGFGSLDAPYAGTANILGSSLLGAIVFVALWSPRLFPGQTRPLRRIAQATVASIVSLGGFGLIAWGIAQRNDLLPTFDTMVYVAETIGLLPLAIIAGAAMGATLGMVIGGACGLVGKMQR